MCLFHFFVSSLGVSLGTQKKNILCGDHMCSSACLLHILTTQIVEHFLLEFTMGGFLMRAFGQFQYSAVLTHSEFCCN